MSTAQNGQSFLLKESTEVFDGVSTRAWHVLASDRYLL